MSDFQNKDNNDNERYSAKFKLQVVLNIIKRILAPQFGLINSHLDTRNGVCNAFVWVDSDCMKEAYLILLKLKVEGKPEEAFESEEEKIAISHTTLYLNGRLVSD